MRYLWPSWEGACLAKLIPTWIPAGGYPMEQTPQLEIRSLDEMEDVSAWKALSSDGVSASVHGAKGIEGNALVLEFDLANTAGYAAATRVLPTQLRSEEHTSELQSLRHLVCRL